jgi:hypothetical protein
LGFTDSVTRHSKNDFMCHPTPRITHPIHRRNVATVSEMGPTIAVGSAKAQGFEGETHLWVRAAQSSQSEGRSDTKDDQYFSAPGAPSRGPDILKLRI